MEKVIIDTDPALGIPFRDIDDAYAIAMALNSPELEIVGITLTYGNVQLPTARLSARKILRAAGRRDIPLKSGAASRSYSIYETDASKFIVEQLNDNPGEISLLTIGPLTNASSAERLKKGTLSKAKRIVTMGGAVFGKGIVPPRFKSEFNFWNDPCAAKKFIESSDNITLVPCELTMKVSFARKYLNQLRDADNDLSRLLFDNSLLWYSTMSALRFKDGFPPHDPIAVAYMLKPELFETVLSDIEVIEDGKNKGQTIVSRSGSEVNVATDVDSSSVLELITERVCDSIK